ncbi:hypothetical protein BASA81_005520 [Batrachochytrium salamandrivorans]|nr:hypothetical protein BASA81_005520 [Batrachochytrium salamandrivorans]
MDYEAQTTYRTQAFEEDEAGQAPKYGAAVDSVEQSIRLGFTRKVFGILGLQLLVTLGVIMLFSLVTPVREYVDLSKGQGHPWVFMVGMIGSLASLLTLACCANQARTHPNNLVFLGLFTTAESVLLGVVCAAYTLESVMFAVGVTAMLVLGLVAFASVTKQDFTGAGPYLFVALMSLLMYSVLLSFVPGLRSDLVQTGMTYLGVVLFSFYVVYDTQLILGGKHKKFQFGVDEYVFAAINIYLDIVNLFIRLLQLFGKERD